MVAKQDLRSVEVTSPLGADRLLLRRMTAVDGLSRPFEIDLQLLSTDHAIALSDVLGQPMTVRLDLPENHRRFFNGIVSRFCYQGSFGDFASYEARVRPWLWFLSRTADCRIFQSKTVPDIVKELFHKHGFSDFKDLTTQTYRTREYCVQYRETDFDFVSRLMEEEGIYYYFRHENGKHSLIMGDDDSAWETIAGYGTVPFHPHGPDVVMEHDYLWEWRATQDVQPVRQTLRDFDFTRPNADLEVRERHDEDSHALAEGEIYDYPGVYQTRDEGEALTRVRLQERRALFEAMEGRGDVGGLGPGCVFTLRDHPRTDQNRKYLVGSSTLEVTSNAFESKSAGDVGLSCSCQITALRTGSFYRPPRLTPRPVVEGLQTAFVVGKAGEEIFTDKYGRIKVQFHWDRDGEHDENSSCWMRVGQFWASKGFGAQFIPRIGDEVVVAFLEGDPDRPLVIGSVYNDTNKTPYELPAKQTRSGLRSRSSKGGSAENCNEIYLDDEMGSEILSIHAERDLATSVEADESRSVGGARSTTIDGDETLVIKTGDRKETLEKGSDSLTVSMGGVEISAPLGTYHLSALEVKIEGKTGITLSCGGSSIKLTPGTIDITSAGVVTVKGAMVKINC